MGGCFPSAVFFAVPSAVFPMGGVFPGKHSTDSECICLPHMGGGVSWARTTGSLMVESSPHGWGCFLMPVCNQLTAVVFPTWVGVFPICLSSWEEVKGNFPHMGGGVSIDHYNSESLTWSSPHGWGCFLVRMG